MHIPEEEDNNNNTKTNGGEIENYLEGLNQKILDHEIKVPAEKYAH